MAFSLAQLDQMWVNINARLLERRIRYDRVRSFIEYPCDRDPRLIRAARRVQARRAKELDVTFSRRATLKRQRDSAYLAGLR